MNQGNGSPRSPGNAPPKFELGTLLITPAAQAALTSQDICTALGRHAQGDWGDVDAADKLENERSLREDLRLLSAYHTATGTRFWVITEADRSATTVLLPSDY
jgi:hypothetical protein